MPGFETVNCRLLLLVPVGVSVKARSCGVTLSAAAGSPVPVRPMTKGMKPALVERMVTAPMRVPGMLGAKETVRVHAAPPGSEVPQVF